MSTKRVRRNVSTDKYVHMLRRMIRAAGKRIAKGDVEDLAELLSIRADLDAAVQQGIDGLREDGYTWESIGKALGVTRQAALMRWGRKTS